MNEGEYEESIPRTEHCAFCSTPWYFPEFLDSYKIVLGKSILSPLLTQYWIFFPQSLRKRYYYSQVRTTRYYFLISKMPTRTCYSWRQFAHRPSTSTGSSPCSLFFLLFSSLFLLCWTCRLVGQIQRKQNEVMALELWYWKVCSLQQENLKHDAFMHDSSDSNAYYVSWFDSSLCISYIRASKQS